MKNPITIKFNLEDIFNKDCYKQFTQECIDKAIQNVKDIPIIDREGNCIGVVVDSHNGYLFGGVIVS